MVDFVCHTSVPLKTLKDAYIQVYSLSIFFIQNTTETENIILNVETETEGFTNNIDVLHDETDEEITVV